MTHEDFLGVEPGTVHLTDEDRKRIENTLLWQHAQMREALDELGRVLLATPPLSWIMRLSPTGLVVMVAILTLLAVAGVVASGMQAVQP